MLFAATGVGRVPDAIRLCRMSEVIGPIPLTVAPHYLVATDTASITASTRVPPCISGLHYFPAAHTRSNSSLGFGFGFEFSSNSVQGTAPR